MSHRQPVRRSCHERSSGRCHTVAVIDLSAQAEDNPLDELPRRVIDRLPDDVVTGLREGTIDEIPRDVVEQLPARLQERIPDDLIASATNSTGLTVAIVGVILLGLAGFVYGMAKRLVTLAVVFAAIAVGGFLWYTQR